MGKHSSGKHVSESKNSVKVIIIVLAIICVVATIIARTYMKKEPENVINEFFLEIKEADVNSANQYIDYKQLIDSLDEMILANKDSKLNIEKELFKNIEWNIVNVEFEDDKAVAVVEVKNKNFKNIITKWMKELVSYKSSGMQITNELALKKLEEIIKKEETMKTVIKKVTLNKTEKSWMIEVNEDLRDLVYPGIESVINGLKAS